MRSVVWNGGSRQVLSRNEKKLLKTIVESKGGEPISSLCERAHVSPKTWYRMIENPKLGTLLPEALDYLLGQQLIPVIQVIIKRALEGSAKHGELVLKISGLLASEEPKILQIFSSKGEGTKFLTDADIDRLLGRAK